mmetsp:Transcript_6929/g.21269  ORF Transcript_6929/g.21269 Transcript_6929/m.21269 type:complete len:221 (+) Transcript_6929:2007-2669(+)
MCRPDREGAGPRPGRRPAQPRPPGGAQQPRQRAAALRNGCGRRPNRRGIRGRRPVPPHRSGERRADAHRGRQGHRPAERYALALPRHRAPAAHPHHGSRATQHAGAQQPPVAGLLRPGPLCAVAAVVRRARPRELVCERPVPRGLCGHREAPAANPVGGQRRRHLQPAGDAPAIHAAAPGVASHRAHDHPCGGRPRRGGAGAARGPAAARAGGGGAAAGY